MPLIAGVFAALLVANVAPVTYDIVVNEPITRWDDLFANGVPDLLADGEKAQIKAEVTADEMAEHDAVDTAQEQPHDGDATHEAEASHGGGHHGPWWEHYITLHFLINDIFMVFFFGIAAKEIVESILPGGALNPPAKAINPLLGTIGGVIGPIGVFLLLNAVMGHADWRRGWGIPTATDIALAWLVARIVFGKGHPAISFLLLLAVADDAIGLGIIAFGYPDPAHPTEWANTWWILPGMAIALGLRKMKVQNWMPYILIGGALSWWGLHSAHLHPALALIPIVPFLPHGKKDEGLFVEDPHYEDDEAHGHHHSPLEQFEHQLKLPVDFGLFFFAFANAGVGFETMNNLTWIVYLSLLIGKVVGITALSYGGSLVGFPLPTGMKLKHLVTASVVAGLGLTVALFVAGQAFSPGTTEQAAAKMGALFSGGTCFIAIVIGLMLGVKDGGGSKSG